ncbi:post-GPI attachment to proteins factor 6-like, partial [Saccoglossus kowalevskii]|uniref:Transmembrane protein 8A-like n=1 Tax=Saccoglossus kowalevskii TaxID=10224 RepID=A0ABM0MST3_SACKO
MADMGKCCVHLCLRWFVFFFITEFASPEYRTGNEEVASNSQWYQPVEVFEYKGYRNVQLFHYKMASHVTESMWHFTAFQKGDDSCQQMNVQIALQWGSYPVINPTNTSFPEDTVLKRTALLEFETPSDYSVKFLTYGSPLEGDWFAAAYLPSPTESAEIQPHGLGETCHYFLGSWLEYKRQVDIPVLTSYTVFEDYMHDSKDSFYYKFYVATNFRTLQFILNGCELNSSLTLDTRCPLEIAVRPNALPHQYVDWTDCNDTCDIQVIQPLRSSWYYLEVKRTIENVSISFVLSVEVEDCKASDGYHLYQVPTSDSHHHPMNIEVLTPHIESTFPYVKNVDSNEVESRTSSLYQMNPKESQFTNLNTFDDVFDNNTCLPGAPMERLKYVQDFSIKYTHRDSTHNSTYNVVFVEPMKPSIVSFDIRPIIELGGSITVIVKLLEE